MIYLFNEMTIEAGDVLNSKLRAKRVFHIDCRGTMKNKYGWVDELHPVPENFKRIADTFERCINGKAPDKNAIYYVDITQMI